MNSNSYHYPKQANYRIEIIIAILTFLGVCFIQNSLDIRTVFQIVLGAIGNVAQFIRQSFETIIINPIVEMDGSDMVGVLLLATAFSLAVRRVRQYLTSSASGACACPSCGEKLHRIHRTRGQHLISKILCLDSACLHCEKCDYNSLLFSNKVAHQA